MSVEAVKELVAKADQNPELRAKFNGIMDSHEPAEQPKAVAALGAENGCVFSEADYEQARSEAAAQREQSSADVTGQEEACTWRMD